MVERTKLSNYFCADLSIPIYLYNIIDMVNNISTSKFFSINV